MSLISGYRILAPNKVAFTELRFVLMPSVYLEGCPKKQPSALCHCVSWKDRFTTILHCSRQQPLYSGPVEKFYSGLSTTDRCAFPQPPVSFYFTDSVNIITGSVFLFIAVIRLLIVKSVLLHPHPLSKSVGFKAWILNNLAFSSSFPCHYSFPFLSFYLFMSFIMFVWLHNVGTGILSSLL